MRWNDANRVTLLFPRRPWEEPRETPFFIPTWGFIKASIVMFTLKPIFPGRNTTWHLHFSHQTQPSARWWEEGWGREDEMMKMRNKITVEKREKVRRAWEGGGWREHSERETDEEIQPEYKAEDQTGRWIRRQGDGKRAYVIHRLTLKKKRKRWDGRVTRGMEGGSEGREHRARKIGYKEVMSVQKSVSI